MVFQCYSLLPDFTHQHSQPFPATTSACHYPVAYCGEFITIESRSHTPTPSHPGRSAGVNCIVTIIIKNCIIVVPSLSSTYIYNHSGISLTFHLCFRFAFVHVHIFMSSLALLFLVVLYIYPPILVLINPIYDMISILFTFEFYAVLHITWVRRTTPVVHPQL